MKNSIGKKKLIPTIVVVLLMACVTPMSMQIPQAQAQLVKIGTSPTTVAGYPNLGPLPAGVTPAYTYVSHAFLSFRPNPIGVGQSLLVNVWTSPGMYHAFYMEGYKVTIQKPDGSQVVVGPFNSYTGDATAWFEYVVDQVGTWKFKFESPGTYMPAGTYWDLPGSETGGFAGPGKYYTLGASVYYTPSATDWQELTVQQTMVSGWPLYALPTDYWTRPVNVIHREWSPILGSYPFAGSAYYYPNGRVLYASNYKYTAYVQAPNTAHIVWKRLFPTALAGMVGGYTYDYSLASGPGTPSIIFQGRCYQSVTKFFENGTSGTVFQCYDLRTGEVYWERALSVTPSYIEYQPPTPTIGGAAGAVGHEADVGWSINLIAISGSFLYKFSPATGALSSNISISPLSGGTYYMPGYALTVQDLGAAAANATGGRYRLINWTTYGTSTNFTSRIANNVTFPRSSTAQMAFDYDAGIGVYCWWASPPGPQWCIGHEIQSIDLKTGAVLWYDMNNDTLSENIQGSAIVCDHGKFAFGAHGRVWTCWDARTGKKLWTSEQTEYPWGAWWPYNQASYDFNESKGAIITPTYEGVYAIDWDTGKILWHYKDPEAVPFENPYDQTPYFTGVFEADGKIYTYNGEHTASFPRARDWKIHCINATTGQGIWKMFNPMVPGAVADGYLVASNSYDGYMYVFGKGKSQTTVTASPKTIANGARVLIEGTVLDQSPAQPGTPCVSAASMETQMEYLHIQMPINGLWHNETITGVPVTLTAIGTDGTVIDIGTTTTNGYYGAFGYAWTPPKEDTYTIMASFNGDDSYGSSTAATFVAVGPAPASPTPTPTSQPQVQPDNTPLLYGILVAVIVAIIIGLLALFRRRS